jgi:hypothetical protein
MKPRFRLSEREQVIGIIVLAFAGLLTVWLLLVRPQARLAQENDSIRRQLGNSPYATMSMESLSQASERESAAGKRLAEEWRQARDRLATFSNQKTLRKTGFGRIDYKVELFRTRERLAGKSQALGIQLIPTDLGIDDALHSNEKIRERMLQLKAVEKLADLTLDRRIQRLVEILPLPPIEHKGPDKKATFDEYPVKVEFDADFDNLCQLFQAVFEEHQVFAFRNIRIESGPTVESRLRVKAVMSAFVFE